jgi:hypothetical protein
MTHLNARTMLMTVSRTLSPDIVRCFAPILSIEFGVLGAAKSLDGAGSSGMAGSFASMGSIEPVGHAGLDVGSRTGLFV